MAIRFPPSNRTFGAQAAGGPQSAKEKPGLGKAIGAAWNRMIGVTPPEPRKFDSAQANVAPRKPKMPSLKTAWNRMTGLTPPEPRTFESMRPPFASPRPSPHAATRQTAWGDGPRTTPSKPPSFDPKYTNFAQNRADSNPPSTPKTSDPKLRGQTFLANFSVADVDKMNSAHLRKVAEHLGVPAQQIPPGADLTKNWAALRASFPIDAEMAKAIQQQPTKVAQVLAFGPARRTQGNAESPPRPSPGTSGTGNVPPGGASRPTAPAAAPRKTSLPPVVLSAMAAGEVVDALKERGMSSDAMKQFKADVRAHALHGDGASAELLKQKYGKYVADDFSAGSKRAALWRNLKNI